MNTPVKLSQLFPQGKVTLKEEFADMEIYRIENVKTLSQEQKLELNKIADEALVRETPNNTYSITIKILKNE